MARHEVVSERRQWRPAFDDAHKMAAGSKRRGRRVYKHYVRAVRRNGRVVAWRVTREARR